MLWHLQLVEGEKFEFCDIYTSTRRIMWCRFQAIHGYLLDKVVKISDNLISPSLTHQGISKKKRLSPLILYYPHYPWAVVYTMIAVRLVHRRRAVFQTFQSALYFILTSFYPKTILQQKLCFLGRQKLKIQGSPDVFAPPDE